MFLLLSISGIMNALFWFTGYWIRTHEISARKCYHWFVVSAFSMICFAQPNNGIAQYEHRLNKVEQATDKLIDEVHRHNPVTEARIEALSQTQLRLLTTQTAILSRIDNRDGVFQGLGIAGSVLLLIIAVFSYLGIRGVNRIEAVAHSIENGQKNQKGI